MPKREYEDGESQSGKKQRPYREPPEFTAAEAARMNSGRKSKGGWATPHSSGGKHASGQGGKAFPFTNPQVCVINVEISIVSRETCAVFTKPRRGCVLRWVLLKLSLKAREAVHCKRSSLLKRTSAEGRR